MDELVDFGVEPLPGDELHTLMSELREQRRVAPVKFAGGDALLLTRYDDVHEAFADSERLPGGDLYRKLATPAFRSRAVARFDEESLVPLTNEVIDRFVNWGAADLVAELTSVLPFAAITRKLGLPPSSEDNMRQWAEGMLTYPFEPQGALRAAAEFSTQLEPILSARREDPQEDVFSELVRAELDGKHLTDDDVYA